MVDVDRTLLRENLKLTPAQRLEKLVRFSSFASTEFRAVEVRSLHQPGQQRSSLQRRRHPRRSDLRTDLRGQHRSRQELVSCRAHYTIHRYDNFQGNHLPRDFVPLRLTFALRHVGTGEEVPLVSNQSTFPELVAKDDPLPNPPPAPEVVQSSRVFNLRPAEGVQLDSVDGDYFVVATIEHRDDPSQSTLYTTGNSLETAETHLLHFNGTLWFGPVESRFTSIANDPAPFSVTAGSHVVTVLAVDEDSGFIVSNPEYTYGNGIPLPIYFLSNGDALLEGSSTPLNMPSDHPFQTVNCVRFRLRDPSNLTSEGLVAHYQVVLPAGAGYRMDTQSHLLRSRVSFGPTLAGNGLLPPEDLTFAPAGGFFFSEESKPLWFEVNSLTWRVTEGRFELATVGQGVEHVRTDEYAILDDVAPSLHNPQRELKRSNDR
jgi:hypothetical protein